MDKNNNLIEYYKNDISQIADVLHSLSEHSSDKLFYAFVNNYGKKKVANILSAYGIDAYGILPSLSSKNIDEITKNLINKATGKNYKLTKLYSSYCYSKYSGESNILFEQNSQIVFDCLTINENIDIKKIYSLNDLKNSIIKGDVVLLGVKEKPMDAENFFNANLQKVDKSYITNFGNEFLQKHIFPSIKYSNNDEIVNNINYFNKLMPKLEEENNKIQKEIIKTILKYELQNQQILLSDKLEKTQREMLKLANQYRVETQKIGKIMNYNNILLQTLTKEKNEENDFELEYSNEIAA